MSGKIQSKRKLPLTTPVEEGPYYAPDSPERHKITEKGTPGTKLVVEGRVLDAHGQPIAHAWLDFWQADGNGRYDNLGYNLRGHQYTDKDGRYRAQYLLPGEKIQSVYLHLQPSSSLLGAWG